MNKKNNYILLKAKNYLSFLINLPGSTMWQHLYLVDENGDEFDAADNGDKSCAYLVSSVLCIFQLIDKPHATVKSTLREMEKAGWRQVKKPVKGAVIHWEEHLGFYLADDFVVSNNSITREVVRHKLVLDDGRKPLDFYIHPELI